MFIVSAWSVYQTGKRQKNSRVFFIRDAESGLVSDPQKTEELFKRTPGYASWQGEYWLACCNDYCAFIGDVGTEELERMGIADEVLPNTMPVMSLTMHGSIWKRAAAWPDIYFGVCTVEHIICG